MASITLSESSKRVVENITKIVCELMTLKVEIISEGNQGTEKQQKQLYVLNQLLKTYSQKKKDVLNKSFEYIPCVTTYTEQFALFDDIKSTDADDDNSSKESSVQNTKEEEDNATESEYEFSDVDEEETKVVNKVMAKATTKLKRNRQTKQYIHITTTY